jgi:hypothetical protein
VVVIPDIRNPEKNNIFLNIVFVLLRAASYKIMQSSGKRKDLFVPYSLYPSICLFPYPIVFNFGKGRQGGVKTHITMDWA